MPSSYPSSLVLPTDLNPSLISPLVRLNRPPFYLKPVIMRHPGLTVASKVVSLFHLSPHDAIRAIKNAKFTMSFPYPESWDVAPSQQAKIPACENSTETPPKVFSNSTER